MDEEALRLLSDVALIDQELQLGLLQNNIEEISSKNVPDDSSRNAEPAESHNQDSVSPIEYNKYCQELLKTIETKLTNMLEENRKEQQIISQYLNKPSTLKKETLNKKSVIKYKENQCIKYAGIPYFKDFDGYPQPRNEDVIEKLRNKELLCADLFKKSPMWSNKDKELLTKLVLKEHKRGELQKKQSSNDNYEEVPDYISNESEKSCVSVQIKTVDWLKISVTDFNGKFSATECETIWRLYLKPEINKSKWIKNEIEALNDLANTYRNQDWDNIAAKLGTNRTGFQCCIQYQTKNSLNEGKWSYEEDKFLKQLVKKFTICNNIPWSKIAWYFQTRNIKQCRNRYLDHLQSDLKKGPFSAAEDKIIIFGYKLFKDCGEIANFLPGRVPSQIRSRYYYLTSILMPEFTKQEDELLMSLVKKHSKDWLRISEYFKDRSTVQCRTRYNYLCKLNTKTPNAFFKKMLSQQQNSFKQTLHPVKKVKKTYGKGQDAFTVYDEILDYCKYCSENLFGPKIRSPTTDMELKELTYNLRAMMSMLSVNCNFSYKTGMMESLEENCNFNFYDIKLLKKLPEDDDKRDFALEENYSLNGMLIPPNYCTVMGLYSLRMNRHRVRTRTCEVEGLPLTLNERKSKVEDEERPLFLEAKSLFKSRIRSLFSLSHLLDRVPLNDMNMEHYRKKKAKKPKKLTRRWLKMHAKYMSLVYQEKRKKAAEDDDESMNFADDVGEEEKNINVCGRKSKKRKAEANEDKAETPKKRTRQRGRAKTRRLQ